MESPPLYYKSASVALKVLPNKVLSLKSLYSVKQRQGHAGELLRLICEYADKHGFSIELEAKQFGHTRGLDNEGLVKFYAKYGFVLSSSKEIDKLFMTRPSQYLHGL